MLRFAGAVVDAVGFLVRMKPAEVAALRELAADAGTTVGVYGRELLRRRLRRARPKGNLP